MTRKKPNALQRAVRGAVKNTINQINSQKKSRKTKSTTQKSNPKIKTKKSTKSTEIKQKSRYISKSDRVTLLNRDNYKCVFCGRTAKQVELQIDHIVPFSKGGSNEIDNLQTLCVDCNLGKSDRIL